MLRLMRLKEWLALKKLTAADLAPLIGVSRVTAYRIASGESHPRPKTQRKIEQITDGAVTPSDIVRGLR